MLEILFKSIYSLQSNMSKTNKEKRNIVNTVLFVMYFVHQMFVLLQDFTGRLLQAVRELLVIISLVFA